MKKNLTLALALMLAIIKIQAQKNIQEVFAERNNPNHNRILLYEKKHFVWIYENYIQKDTELIVVFGNYYVNDSVIKLTPPDSIDKSNSLFGYFKVKGENKKEFHFYNKSKDKIIRPINSAYMQLYGITEPLLPIVLMNFNATGILKGDELKLDSNIFLKKE